MNSDPNAGAADGPIERPGASPLEGAALRFVAGQVLRDEADYTLTLRVLPAARGILSRVVPRTRYLACYVSRDGDLHLESALALVRASLADGRRLGNGGLGKAAGSWFLLSDRGGIYLHETVTAEESWRRAGRRSRLFVLNPENGTACLSPGHARNRELSARLRDLLESYRLTPRAAWEREAEKALSMCLDEL